MFILSTFKTNLFSSKPFNHIREN